MLHQKSVVNLAKLRYNLVTMVTTPAFIDYDTACRLLIDGHTVAIPTETVYGLAASLHSANALARVFTLKNRPVDHPLILHFSRAFSLEAYAVDIPPYVPRLLQAFCPGPLTLILKRAPSVPALVTGGQETVGIRFPDHPLACALIESVGHPLAAPSANRFGKISPTCAQHVYAEFGDSVKILDGGPCRIGIESTIVDATHPERCAILRHGSIHQALLEAALAGSAIVGTPAVHAPRVSGSLKQHYAPNKPAFLFHSINDLRVLQSRFARLSILSLLPNPDAYARVLYDRMRRADVEPTDAIAIESPPASPEWAAVRDRLSRACKDCYTELT